MAIFHCYVSSPEGTPKGKIVMHSGICGILGFRKFHRNLFHIFRAESTKFWPCLGKPAWWKWSSQEFPLDLLSNPSKRKTALRSGEITETSTIGFSPERGTGASSLFLLLEGEGWHHASNGRLAMWGLKMRDITLKQPSKLVISSQESIICGSHAGHGYFPEDEFVRAGVLALTTPLDTFGSAATILVRTVRGLKRFGVFLDLSS